MPEHSTDGDGNLTAEGELFSKICSKTGRSYDLTEHVNDTNREYTQVLSADIINSGATESYSYAENQRLSRNNVWNEARGVDHNETSYYLYDGRGSVTANTWYNGMVTNAYQYDPYGEVSLSSADHEDFYGYNAESYNPNTGLEYLRSRYYNADMGRFFQEDTYLGKITDPLTLNRYAYVKNCPMNYVDPSGHIAQVIVGAAIGGAVSGITNYIMQKISGNDKINQRELWTNVLAGAISGAIGGTELKKGALALMNATISGVSYWQSREANNQNINIIDLFVAVAAGALTGVLGGNSSATNAEIKSYEDVLGWMKTWGYMSYFDMLKKEMNSFLVETGLVNFAKTIINSGVSNLWDLIKLAKKNIQNRICDISEELDEVEYEYTTGGKNMIWETS